MPFRRSSRTEVLSDYTRLWNLEHPLELIDEDEARSWFDMVLKGVFEERWIDDGTAPRAVVSVVADDHSQPPKRVYLELAIDPAAEPGVIQEVLEVGENLAREACAPCISVWHSDRNAVRSSALRENGYQLVQTAPVTRLHIPSFDASRFEERIAKAAEGGIRICTVADLEAEGVDWVPGVHEAAWEMTLDMPHVAEPTPIPLEDYRERLKDKVTYNYDLMFVAMDGDRAVAYSRITPARVMPKLARTGLTGVVRTHRRRGIATAIKVAGIEKVRGLGYEWLQTDNDETNPMYQLNLELGYRPVWSWLHFEKKLS